MDRSYRLPDGTITKDPDEYGNAWLALGEAVSAKFPGYKAQGFNPTIEFVKWEKNRWGQDIITDRFVLTLAAIKALLGQ